MPGIRRDQPVEAEVNGSAHLFIQTFSGIIQAAMTIGVLVVTLLYVIFTKKILDQNYSTFVVITGLKPSGKHLSATAENHGTATALNISITAITANGPIVLKGPGMLAAGENAVYNGELRSKANNNGTKVEISYRSQTRKKRTELWQIRDDEIIYLGKK